MFVTLIEYKHCLFNDIMFMIHLKINSMPYRIIESTFSISLFLKLSHTNTSSYLHSTVVRTMVGAISPITERLSKK